MQRILEISRLERVKQVLAESAPERLLFSQDEVATDMPNSARKVRPNNSQTDRFGKLFCVILGALFCVLCLPVP
jgi:hypothetical protein